MSKHRSGKRITQVKAQRRARTHADNVPLNHASQTVGAGSTTLRGYGQPQTGDYPPVDRDDSTGGSCPVGFSPCGDEFGPPHPLPILNPSVGHGEQVHNEFDFTINPFVSQKQRAACYAKREAGEKGWNCDEWEAHTPEGKLPERKKNKRTQKREKARAVRNARKAAAINPLRLDPSRLSGLRRSLETELNRRFALLKGRIVKLVAGEDAFGLGQGKSAPTANLAGPHEFASCQLNVDAPDVAEALAFVQSRLDPTDVMQLEDEPHVTVRYGLDPTVDHGRVAALLGGTGAVQLRFGPLSFFSGGDKGDVLKWEVESQQLRELNRRLGLLPHQDTHREYNPHMTVAYLKPGTAAKYLTLPDLLHGEAKWFLTAAHSDAEGWQTEVTLNELAGNARVGSLFPSMQSPEREDQPRTREASGGDCGTGKGGFQPGNTCGVKSTGSTAETVKAAQGGDKEAIAQVLRENHGAVVKMARRHASGNALSRQEFGDLVAEGQLGLIRAVQKFDPSKHDVKFITYAWHWIRAKVGAAMRRIHRDRQVGSLEVAGGKGKEGGQSRLDPVGRPEVSPEQAEEHASRTARLHEVLAGLNKRDRDVMERRYGLGRHADEEPQSQEEIGKVHGLTKQRVGQIERGVLEKLRGQLAGNALVFLTNQANPRTVYVDFDGTITDDPLTATDLSRATLRDGAKESVATLRRAGVKVMIHSANENPDAVKAWLKAHGIVTDGYVVKPPGMAYVDDRGVQAHAGRDWDDVLAQTMKLVAGEPRQPIQPTTGYEELADLATEAELTLASILSRLGCPVIRPQYLDLGELETALARPGPVVVLPPVKGEERATEKVEEDYGGNWSRLLDMVRAAVACDTLAELHAVADKVTGWVTEAGGSVARLPHDRFRNPLANGYRDLLVNYRLPVWEAKDGQGFIVEVQYHLKPMLLARERERLAYDVVRAIKGSVAAEGRDQLTPAEAEAIRRAREGSRQLFAKAWAEVKAGDPDAQRLPGLEQPTSNKFSDFVTDNQEVPDVRQRDDWDCGTGALQSALKAMGVDVPYAELRQTLGTDKQDGTRPAEIVRVARGLGLVAERFYDDAEMTRLRDHLAQGHLVLCPVQTRGTPGGRDASREGHWVVVTAMDEDSVSVQDPITGPEEVPLARWLRDWHDRDADGIEHVRLGIALSRLNVSSFKLPVTINLSMEEWNLISPDRFATATYHEEFPGGPSCWRDERTGEQFAHWNPEWGHVSNASWFAECPRDDKGYCTSVGGQASGTTTLPRYHDASTHEAEAKAQSILNHYGAKVNALVDRVPVVGKIKGAVQGAMAAVKGKLAARYGDKAANVIMASGSLGGYGVMAASIKLLGFTVPVVTDVVSIAAHVAVAEGLHQLGILRGTSGGELKGKQPTANAEDRMPNVVKAYHAWQEVADRTKGVLFHLANRLEEGLRGEDAAYWTPEKEVVGNAAEDQPRDEKGRFTGKGGTAEEFHALGAQQRDKPESAMLKVQHAYGGGVLNPVVEHVGDLIHRMTEEPTFANAGHEFVKAKVERMLDRLDRPHDWKLGGSFGDEVRRSIGSNADYLHPNDASKRVAYRDKVDAALKNYADAHRKLEPLNEAQHHANQAAIAVGEKRWGDAIDHLKELKAHLGSREEWVKYAHQGLVTNALPFSQELGWPTVNAAPWATATDPARLQAFQDWLRDQYKGLGLDDEQLWQRYATEGYRKGQGRAWDDTQTSHRAQLAAVADPDAGETSLKGRARSAQAQQAAQRGLDFYDGTRDQFLRSSFGSPVAVDKIKLLAARSFAEMKNVTHDMATRLGRVLADGMAQGKNPRQVARDMVGQVDFSHKRALLVARTELSRAHASGQLHALRDLGMGAVGVDVEWLTTGQPCDACADMADGLYSLEDAEGLIPHHPNCRCAWKPAIGKRKPTANAAPLLAVGKRRPTNNNNPEGCNQYKPCNDIQDDKHLVSDELATASEEEVKDLREAHKLLMRGVIKPKSTLESVAITNLIALQKHFWEGRVNEFRDQRSKNEGAEDPEEEASYDTPLTVWRLNGKNYLEGGHHRAIAARRDLITHLTAEVTDLSNDWRVSNAARKTPQAKNDQTGRFTSGPSFTTEEYNQVETAADLKRLTGVGNWSDDNRGFVSALIALHERNDYKPLFRFAKRYPGSFAKLRVAALRDLWEQYGKWQPFGEFLNNGKVLAYRGSSKNDPGIAWSLDRRLALGFAEHSGGWGGGKREGGVVSSAFIQTKDILYYSNAQKEQEVITKRGAGGPVKGHPFTSNSARKTPQAKDDKGRFAAGGALAHLGKLKARFPAAKDDWLQRLHDDLAAGKTKVSFDWQVLPHNPDATKDVRSPAEMGPLTQPPVSQPTPDYRAGGSPHGTPADLTFMPRPERPLYADKTPTGELPRATAGVNPNLKVTDPGEVAAAVHRLAARSRHGVVPVHELHDALGRPDLPGFHRAINDLRRAGLVQASEHEGRAGISQREAETAIREPRGSGSHDAKLTSLWVPDMDRLLAQVSTGTGQLRGAISNATSNEDRDAEGRWTKSDTPSEAEVLASLGSKVSHLSEDDRDDFLHGGCPDFAFLLGKMLEKAGVAHKFIALRSPHINHEEDGELHIVTQIGDKYFDAEGWHTKEGLVDAWKMGGRIAKQDPNVDALDPEHASFVDVTSSPQWGYVSQSVDRRHTPKGKTTRERFNSAFTTNSKDRGDAKLTSLWVPDMDRLRMHVSTGTGQLRGAVGNLFCPTGEGGGVDPTCGKGGGGGGGGKADRPDVVSAEEHQAAIVKAINKMAAAPRPTRQERKEAREGIARLGANKYLRNLVGNTGDRRKRRQALLKEFGYGTHCPCVYCGLKLDDAALEQDKIYTTAQGGRYRVPNLLPCCGQCNKERSDMPIVEALKKAVTVGYGKK